VKGKEATAQHLQRVGEALYRLLQLLKSEQEQEAIYQVGQRFFTENFQVVASETVQAKEAKELGSDILQSLDDLEATYRQKGNQSYKGYVANASETCAPTNPVQLITEVQVAPNNVEDADLMIEAVPQLQKRMSLEALITDGAYGSPAADQVLSDRHIELHQTAIRGTAPNPNKLNLSDLTFQTDEKGQPSQVICPQAQTGIVLPGTSTEYIAYFDASICRDCPWHQSQHCRVRRVKHDRTLFNWAFSHKEFLWAQRRKRYLALKQQKTNLRCAVEATMRSLKHAFPAGKLPVRGRFRVTCLIIAAAAITNVRRIYRYLKDKDRPSDDSESSQGQSFDSFMSTLSSTFACFHAFWQVAQSCFSC
jgi:hypothetical protein